MGYVEDDRSFAGSRGGHMDSAVNTAEVWVGVGVGVGVGASAFV